MERSYRDRYYSNYKTNNVKPNRIKVEKKIIKQGSTVPTEVLNDLIHQSQVNNYNQGYIKGYAKGVGGFLLAAAVMGIGGYFVGKWVAGKEAREESSSFDESNFKEVHEDGDKEL